MLGLIFTYGLTYGGALVALFNPFVGFLIFVAFSSIWPTGMWHWSVPQGNYSEVVAIAMLIGWVFQGFGQWNFGRARVIVWSLVGFWLWSIVSSMGALDQDLGWEFVVDKGKIVLPFLVAMTLIDSREKLKQLAWVLVLSLGFVAFQLNLSYFEGFNKVYHLGFGGMDNNGVACTMAAGVGIAFFLGVSEGRWWLRGVAWLASLLMAHTVLLAFSRGGMLALVVVGFVSFFLLPSKQPRQMLALVIVILLALRLAGPEVTDRFMTIFADSQEREASAQSRLDLWEDTWDSMLTHPLLGVGPQAWPLVAHEYGWPYGKESHTTWLGVGAELGFPALAFLGLFYGLCLVKLWPVTRGKVKVSDPFIPHVGRMVIASLVGFIIAAQFLNLEGLEFPYYVALLGAGALRFIPKSAALPTLRKVPALSAAASLFPRKS